MRARIRRRVRRPAAPRVRRCPCGGAREGAKERLAEAGSLMIGGARDPAESRAEARAARALSAAPVIHRKCAACEAEEREARRSPSKGVVAPGAAPARASKSAERAVKSLGAGRPLSTPERAFYQPRLGADLSPVRLHEDSAADRAARAMDARAFTLGADIAFARGERAKSGADLMAHELAHAAEGEGAVRRNVMPPPPERTPHVCGPHVEDDISAVWSQIQSDFGYWPREFQRLSCLYLVAPFVPVDPLDPSSRVEANRDAFDTLGLYQDGAEWQRAPPFHPPCGVPGSIGDPGDNFAEEHEDPARCANTVTTGSGCWLMGTVNYGTFGIMMKLCHDSMTGADSPWFRQRLESSIRAGAEQEQETDTADTDTNIRSAAQTFEEYGLTGLAGAGLSILGPAALFSETSMRALVNAYKRMDGDDPGPPLAWARATYGGGPGAIPSGGGNFSHCDTTCRLQYNCEPFGYVWEPTIARAGWNPNCARHPAPPSVSERSER
jgi:hypothetical protein